MLGDDSAPEARPRTPEEMVLHRLRTIGLGLLVAAVLYDGVQIPLKRWRALRARVITGVNPLDPPGSMFVAGVADFLTSLDGSRKAPPPPELILTAAEAPRPPPRVPRWRGKPRVSGVGPRSGC